VKEEPVVPPTVTPNQNRLSVNPERQNIPGSPIVTSTVEPDVPAAFSSADVVAAAKERMFERKQEEAADMFDESDLDIPAFIREHRNKNS
ncbi:MAG TPA: hypothetical protein VK171_07775, partial [Fimbriimonas sp.]|nr:hypothetical protein [Fimbriimonas sp.]